MKFKVSKSIHKLSDAELIASYQKTEDGKYFGELFTRYTHLVFGTCMKYLKNVDDSKDAVVQIFEKLLKDLKTFEVKNFKGWLYQVSKNHCLMHLRKLKSQSKKSEGYEIEVKNNVETTEELHLFSEGDKKEIQLEKLSGALEQLQEKQKKCLELFYLKEMSYNQVVDETGYSLKEVKSYIQNGKRNLKKLMTTLGSLLIILILKYIL